MSMQFIYLAPQYEIDLNESVYCSVKYDDTNHRCVFTVEQGAPFVLKLNVRAWPAPSRVVLYKGGDEVQQSSNQGTIFVALDKIVIQNVDRQSYAGIYTITATNDAGTGQLSFELKVQGTSCAIIN